MLKKLNRIGYDFDGVLLPVVKRNNPFFHQRKFDRDQYNQNKAYYLATAKPLIFPPEKEFYIISGRKASYKVISEKWLEQNGIKPLLLILMEGKRSFKTMLAHKYKYLKELEITKYYEDDPKLVKGLQKLLPNIEVVQVPQVSIMQEDITIPDNNQLKLTC